MSVPPAGEMHKRVVDHSGRRNQVKNKLILEHAAEKRVYVSIPPAGEMLGRTAEKLAGETK